MLMLRAYLVRCTEAAWLSSRLPVFPFLGKSISHPQPPRPVHNMSHSKPSTLCGRARLCELAVSAESLHVGASFVEHSLSWEIIGDPSWHGFGSVAPTIAVGIGLG